MDQLTAKISESARVLGLDPQDERVIEARHIAHLALADGRTDEEAYEFARVALVGAPVAA